MYIVQADGRPAGSLRLERRDPACAELSITLAPDARGRGLGRAAITLGVEQARDALGVSTVLARVREDNPRSVRAFAAVGFVAQRNADGLIEMSRALACAP
jgi:RimJ/RimL family protein N-acetyltransferase